VAPAAVYIALRRLEKRGLVKSRMVENDAETGRPRRYFALEEAALEKLRKARQALASLWDGMDAALEAWTRRLKAVRRQGGKAVR